MKGFPTLTTSEFIACIADNSSMGAHCAGYNGVASLIPRRTGNNLFVPAYGGLNYETVSLAGLEPYQNRTGMKFEPRCEPMQIEETGNSRVVLVQPETSHAHVSARIIFSVEEPHYLHQRIELTCRRRFCAESEGSALRSLWASYLHMPPDRHVYMRVDETASDLEGWVGVTKEDHYARGLLVRPLADDRELQAAEHLALMVNQRPLPPEDLSRRVWSPRELPKNLDGPLRFYYGFCHDATLFLMMFKQPERFRFAYSPCGGGKEPAWNPAWDYVLHLDNAELERTYCWDLCLAVKKYRSRADILNEVRCYRNTR